MLWVRGRFWIGEIVLIANLFNLTSLYFRHSKTPLLVHISIVSAPYAWNYVAILWDGAAAVNAQNLAARILANIVVWGILVLGGFFVFTFKDYAMGFCFAILSLCKPARIVVRTKNAKYFQRSHLPNYLPRSLHSSGSLPSSSSAFSL